MHKIRPIGTSSSLDSACIDNNPLTRNHPLLGSKLAFVIFRQQAETLQGVLACKDGVSESMIRWARRTPRETIVLVEGEVESPSCREGIVESTTKRNIEIRVKKVRQTERLGLVRVAAHPKILPDPRRFGGYSPHAVQRERITVDGTWVYCDFFSSA